jgi:hypothetical protein
MDDLTLYYYYVQSPPYAVLCAGLLIAMTSGLAFQETLKQSVKDWSKNRSTRTLATLRGIQIGLPFIGMGIGVCLFLASGLQIFAFPGMIAYGISFPLTVGGAWLVWFQLGKLLDQLERGGSKALDLDSWG